MRQNLAHTEACALKAGAQWLRVPEQPVRLAAHLCWRSLASSLISDQVSLSWLISATRIPCMRDDEQPGQYGNERSSLDIGHIYSPIPHRTELHTHESTEFLRWVGVALVPAAHTRVGTRRGGDGPCRTMTRSPHTRGNKTGYFRAFKRVDGPVAIQKSLHQAFFVFGRLLSQMYAMGFSA